MPPVSKHEKGSVEYYADLAAWRERRAARKAEKAPERPQEGLLDSDEVFDLGDPEPARMATPSAPDKVSGRKGRPKKLAKSEMLREEDVHRHIKWPLEMLSKWEGHEHWHREDDEIQVIAEPATRILNRHPEWVDTLRTFGDPGALIFACVMVLGPSVMEEINRVRGNQQPVQRQQERQPVSSEQRFSERLRQHFQQPPQRPQAPSGAGPAGDAFPGPAQAAPGAAAIIPPPPDLPSQFLS